jgi:hypothetical protein
MRSVGQPIGRERTFIGVGSDAAHSDLRNDDYDDYDDYDEL